MKKNGTDIDNDNDKDTSSARPVEVLAFDTTETPDSYVPDGFKTKEDFLLDMREEHDKDIDFDRHNRDQALEDKKFTAGEQWDPLVLEQRQGLPCLVINSVPQFIAQLVGDWRESKRGIKVLPTEDGDKDIADIRADLIRSIETQSRADRVYDNAFESCVQCGDGAFRVAVEYARDDVFDQDIFIRPIDDALSVVWDRLSVDPTGRDARHVFVDDLVPLKYFEKKWPDKQPTELPTRVYNQMLADKWVEPEGVRVTEFWRMVERDRFLTLFEDGTMRFVDNDLDELVQQHGKPTKSRLAPCMYAQMHLVTGWDILSGPFEYQLSRLPIIRMTGRVVNIAGTRVRYGLVRWMKDSVRLRNFWRSVAAEQLGYAPKAQWIAPESAVEGREDEFRQAHMTRDPLLIYNDDATAPPERIEPPAMQTALHEEAQINIQDMKDVTGIHDASLGIKSNETSGRAINARQREGDVASLTYYDNGNAAVMEGGDVVNQLISQIYDGTRIVRIIGEDEKIKFLRINDPSDPRSPDLAVGKYDVALTNGASYTTRRVEAAQAMMDAVQVFPQLMQVAGDLVAKAQDWPGAEELAERLQMTIPQQFLKPEERTQPDPQVQQLQMQMAQLAQENQQLKTDREIDIKKLVIDIYNAETQRIKALSDNQVDANPTEMEGIQNILDTGLKLHGALLDQDQHEHEQNMDKANLSLQAQNQAATQDLQQKQLKVQAQKPAKPTGGQ
jgi:Phage P22-like portal protein